MRSCHVLIAIVLTSATATSQMFARFETSPFSTPPQGPVIAAIDGDGDGKNDLIVANTTTNAIDFYRYEGPHEFVLTHSSPWTTAPHVYPGLEPAFGDIDGDGDVDILRGSTIVENLGGGAFQVIGNPPGLTVAGERPRLLDIEGDGDLDILQDDRLLRNEGNWAFTLLTGSAAPNLPFLTYSTTVLDADRDGDMDFAVGNLFPLAEVFLFRNDGNGLFTREHVMNTGQQVIRVHTADLNGDGYDDLAVVGDSQSHLLANDGSGFFTPQPINLGTNYDGLFVDLHANGNIQFVTTTGVLDPHFGFQEPYPPEIATPATPIVADLDGDLDLDIVITGQATVLTNTELGLQSASAPRIAPFQGLEGSLGKSLDGQFPEAAFVTWNSNELAVYTAAVAPYGFRNVPFNGPTPTGVTDATLVTRPDPLFLQTSALQLVTCTPTGPTYHINYWSLTPTSHLPPLGTPTHVASADIDNTFGDDLVFGDPAVAGPRIVLQTATAFVEQSPTLPAAAPSALPVYETVAIADMDGDGDQDIVHELRIIRNEGGGQWSVGTAINATLSTGTIKFVPIDYDGDGDRDLLAMGGTLQLLEHTGGSFIDVTLGHIPVPAWSMGVAGVADIDRDGDEDIVASASAVLLNDNGVFTLHQNLASGNLGGIAVDVNHDGSVDVVTPTGVYENTHTYLRPTRRAAIGGNWQLEVRTWRNGPLPQTAFVAITANPGLPIYQPLGAMGALRIDLGIAAITPIALTSGTGTHTLAVPASPLVLGAKLQAQALVVDNRLLLTGLVTDELR